MFTIFLLYHLIVFFFFVSVFQELHASWDQTTEAVVLHKVEPSHLQALALQYADKVQHSFFMIHG